MIYALTGYSPRPGQRRENDPLRKGGKLWRLVNFAIRKPKGKCGFDTSGKKRCQANDLDSGCPAERGSGRALLLLLRAARRCQCCIPKVCARGVGMNDLGAIRRNIRARQLTARRSSQSTAQRKLSPRTERADNWSRRPLGVSDRRGSSSGAAEKPYEFTLLYWASHRRWRAAANEDHRRSSYTDGKF